MTKKRAPDDPLLQSISIAQQIAEIKKSEGLTEDEYISFFRKRIPEEKKELYDQISRFVPLDNQLEFLMHVSALCNSYAMLQALEYNKASRLVANGFIHEETKRKKETERELTRRVVEQYKLETNGRPVNMTKLLERVNRERKAQDPPLPPYKNAKTIGRHLEPDE